MLYEKPSNPLHFRLVEPNLFWRIMFLVLTTAFSLLAAGAALSTQKQGEKQTPVQLPLIETEDEAVALLEETEFLDSNEIVFADEVCEDDSSSDLED